MAKFHDTFGFFDTVEQAEQFKEKLLNHYQNNRYYMKKYAQEITIGPWLNSNSKKQSLRYSLLL